MQICDFNKTNIVFFGTEFTQYFLLIFWLIKFNPLTEEELVREKATMDGTAIGGKAYLRTNGKVQTFTFLVLQ